MIEYDYLDRITAVTLDGEEVASYNHDRDEFDILHQQDTRTGKTYTRWSSPVFGTLDSILYTRPVGLDFSHVSYVPAIKAFRVFAEIDPDAIQLASLSRRQIPLGGESVPMIPFGYDKPSNALFLPPEYQSINCYVCVYSNSGAAITLLATGDPVVGQPTDVAFVPGNQCSLVGETPEFMQYGFGPTQWSHRYNWGDRTSGIDVQSAPLVKSHTWMTPGPKTITDQFQCGCSLFWGNMSENINVVVPCQDTISDFHMGNVSPQSGFTVNAQGDKHGGSFSFYFVAYSANPSMNSYLASGVAGWNTSGNICSNGFSGSAGMNWVSSPGIHQVFFTAQESLPNNDCGYMRKANGLFLIDLATDTPGCDNFVETMEHELGHMLGLGHSPLANDVMRGVGYVGLGPTPSHIRALLHHYGN